MNFKEEQVKRVEIIEKILKKYEDVFIWNKDAVMPEGGFTRGHFKRGVK